MFCVVFTLNAFPEYARPVPAVVVAYEPTKPPYTASPPLVSDVNLKAFENVDEAVENRPPVNPIVVDVELYPVLTVNGKAALELSVVCKSVPPSVIEPAIRLVVLAVMNEPYVVDE